MAQKRTDESYTFTSEPRAIAARKKPKYREQDGASPTNIMYDKRVVRGSTYAAQPMTQPLQAQPDLRKMGSKRAPTLRLRAPGTPEPVEGRRHMDVQTELYLEELTDTVPESENATQTDAFLDRPATPLFVPLKVGMDVETQIEPGELFDFDAEVEPLLEVLVGKTLEQALQEVCEEEELAALAAHQAHFEALRNAELAAAQRMEAAELRRVEEKERRLAQARERAAAEKRVHEKIAAQTFARSYVSGLVTSVFDTLTDKGFFFDPLAREVETHFLPWLLDCVVDELKEDVQSEAVLESLVAEALREIEAGRQAAELRRVEERAAEEEAAAAAAAAAEAAAAAAAASEAGATAFLALDPPVAPADQVGAIKDALGEGATNTAVVLKLVEDGALTKDAVLDAVAAAGLTFPALQRDEAPAAEVEPAAEAAAAE